MIALHCVRYMLPTAHLLTVLQLSTRCHGNQSADLVVSVVMRRNFLPSTLTTGLNRDELVDLHVVSF